MQAGSIIIGNPPWQNFQDLPNNYKEFLKPLFLEYNLIENKKNLLLGGSRLDIAILVVQVCMQDFLKKEGEAFWFLPLSIFTGESGEGFRNYRTKTGNFELKSIFDFGDIDIFGGVGTKNCFAYFVNNKKTNYPLEYNFLKNDKWNKWQAKPAYNHNGSLLIGDINKPIESIIKIQLPKKSQPRQGVNTCGVNHLYFFDKCFENGNKLELSNSKNSVTVEQSLVYPLVTKKQFTTNQPEIPEKWVILPYNTSGRIMTEEVLKKYPLAWKYFTEHKDELMNRKGVLIQSQIKKGTWWAIMGVGAYSFANQKIIWQAMGQSQFKPIILTQKWQANQSLQVFIPANSELEAEDIKNQLSKPNVEQYLLSGQTAGTMNWAQPSRIKAILDFVEKDNLF